MGRAGFLVLSFGLHAAAAGVLWLARGTAPSASRGDDARERTMPLLLEGAAVESAHEAPRARPSASTPTATAARPLAAPAAVRDDAVPKQPPAHASHAHGAPRDETSPSAGEGPEEGAAESLFGTLPLRSLLVSLSARADLFGGGTHRYAFRYAAHRDADGEAIVTVYTTPQDRAADAVAAILRRYLVQAVHKTGTSLAGEVIVEVSGSDDEGLFSITCDERTRRGSVQFTNGRRLAVDAR
jgi:hypothetical protein